MRSNIVAVIVVLPLLLLDVGQSFCMRLSKRSGTNNCSAERSSCEYVRDYYSQLDAAKKFSYMQLPAANMCVAQSMMMGTFFSRATERQSDPVTCSLCHSFIAGIITAGVKQLPGQPHSSLSHVFSAAGQTTATTVVAQACSRQIDPLDREPLIGELTMLEMCTEHGAALLKESPRLLDKLNLITSATTFPPEFIGGVFCEDLQCCPQDPFVAETVANSAAEQLLEESDIKKIESHGAIGALLAKPGATNLLEESIAFLKLSQQGEQKPVFDGAHASVSEPPREILCTWKYSKARCVPADRCRYQYRLGDLTLQQSCRPIAIEKPTAALPATDEECSWDFRAGDCSAPEVCSQQCRSTDACLDDCCRLTEQESQKEHRQESAGNCAGDSDLAVMASPDTAQQMEVIGKQCFNLWRMNIDVKKSLEGHIKLGFSESCANCFVEMSACVLEKCFKYVAMNKDSPASKTCMTAQCEPQLLSCSGVALDKLPKG